MCTERTIQRVLPGTQDQPGAHAAIIALGSILEATAQYYSSTILRAGAASPDAQLAAPLCLGVV